MMPFHGCYLSFHGFSDDEKKHMEESTEQQGDLYSVLAFLFTLFPRNNGCTYQKIARKKKCVVFNFFCALL